MTMRESDLIRAVWTGHVFEPDGHHARSQCEDRLGAGEVVRLDLDPERSGKSHRHQFAFVRTAWANLPEDIKDAPYAKSEETLRKHALIETGFCDVEVIAVDTPQRAERVAASVSNLAHKLHGYAITKTSDAVVYCYTPQSQSMKAMGGQRFQDSKTAILDWMAALIGVSSDDLARMGKKEAA